MNGNIADGHAEPVDSPTPDQPDASFADLGLTAKSLAGVDRAGFEKPTEIQKMVIPELLAGKDLIVCSETGSGKTAAFVLPVLDLLDYRARHVQVLVLVPTRELCRQVASDFRVLGSGHRLEVAEIYGGVGYGGQREAISRHPQVVVGAPGRVLDLMGSRDLDFRKVGFLVLDEADRMLDMGFIPQVRKIVTQIPRERQTLMFSATVPEEVSKFASWCLNDPVRLRMGSQSRPPDQIEQEAIDLMPSDKEAKLLEIAREEAGTILVFTARKSTADAVYKTLRDQGHQVCVIHSDRSQKLRERAIDGFRAGKYRIMVATDLAQRGLDIEGISLIVNYDLPQNSEDYVHRVGRTGRAQAAGKAISFVTYRDYSTLHQIEKATGHTFKDLGTPARSGGKRSPGGGLKRKIR